ncbi:hypothetical protein E0198_002319 [Clavispora lusitaniae]|nr:hypothetical protein E0198_002319 [Clavispora lusitaniae]
MYSIVDTHVHLLADVHNLVWQWRAPHPLSGDHRVDEFISQCKDEQARFSVKGLVWIEADALYDLDKGIDGVRGPIEECKFVSRYYSGTQSGEGETRPGFIKAMMPWAPIPWGQDVVEYVEVLKKELGPQFEHVKGFRYLLQDKEPGTMTTAKFISGLKWIQEKDYAFEWGIDIHNGGLWQFEESIEVFRQVPNTRYLINHLTKPNLDLDPKKTHESEQFQKWKQCMQQIYELTPNSYMKLSGGFSELPESLWNDLEKAVETIYPWFKVCFDLWGAERTIWASNWPVCSMFAGPELHSKWFSVTEGLFDKIDLSKEDRQKIYESNWERAFGV